MKSNLLMYLSTIFLLIECIGGVLPEPRGLNLPQEISEVNDNISHSSTLVSGIHSDISEVTRAAEEMSGGSTEVSNKARELSALAEQLKVVVDRFKT